MSEPIAVNGGPLGNYTNGAFVSVNVCVPGTSTCQTIDDVLVDTGIVRFKNFRVAVDDCPHSAERLKR